MVNKLYLTWTDWLWTNSAASENIQIVLSELLLQLKESLACYLFIISSTIILLIESLFSSLAKDSSGDEWTPMKQTDMNVRHLIGGSWFVGLVFFFCSLARSFIMTAVFANLPFYLVKSFLVRKS